MHAYRTMYRPHIAQAVVAPAPVVTTPAAPAGIGAPEGIVWTAVAAAAAYAGIKTGMRGNESNFTRAAGWVGGVAAGLAALAGLVGVVAPSYNRFPVRWYWV